MALGQSRESWSSMAQLGHVENSQTKMIWHFFCQIRENGTSRSRGANKNAMPLLDQSRDIWHCLWRTSRSRGVNKNAKTKAKTKTKQNCKNKLKAKTKVHFRFHFRFCFCFHFCFCFCFNFYFCFCFLFRFCFCFHFRSCSCFCFCFSFIFIVFILKFTMEPLGHHSVLQKRCSAKTQQIYWRSPSMQKCDFNKVA